jgi:pre-mRNA-splicing factor SPF27
LLNHLEFNLITAELRARNAFRLRKHRLPRLFVSPSTRPSTCSQDIDVDAPLSDAERNAIVSQIHAERPSDHAAALHPKVSTSYEPKFSAAVEAEHDRLSKGLERPPGSGIDLTRYDNVEPPKQTTPHSDEDKPDQVQQWRSALQKAYTNSAYISGRLTNLSLLETYGKNAWLIGNNQLETLLKDLEKDFAEAKRELERVEQERKTRQEYVQGEMMMLEQSWKKGVRSVVEVQIATEELRQQVLEKKRAAAGS